MTRIDRRRFVQAFGRRRTGGGTGGLAGILASGRAPAFAQGTTLHWVRGSRLSCRCPTRLLKGKIKEQARRISASSSTSKPSTADDPGARHLGGPVRAPDPTSSMAINNWAQLYAESVVDVSDICRGDRQGPGRVLRDREGDRL